MVCDASDSLCSMDYKNKAAFKGTETVDGVDTNKVRPICGGWG